MNEKAVQDYYRDEYSHCFGCGKLNVDGMQIKSHWNGEESICHVMPKPYFTGGFPGNLYGGLIASLIDCHSAATASAAKLSKQGFTLENHQLSRFVTASLKVDYLKPTPMGKVLELRGTIKEIRERKIIVNVTLSAEGEIRAKGEVLLVQLPEQEGTI
ncbi:MAG: PaaI family thioesterase [Spirochaetota bacterium]